MNTLNLKSYRLNIYTTGFNKAGFGIKFEIPLKKENERISDRLKDVEGLYLTEEWKIVKIAGKTK